MDQQSKGKGRRQDDPATKMSKNLSYLLRHGAQKEGVPIRPDGFVKMSDLLKWKSFKHASFQQISAVVENNNKKRFELTKLEDGDWYIRAVQGHTIEEIEDELLLEKITDPSLFPVVVHGTYYQAWDLIKDSGLKTMARNHVHFAIGLPGEQAVISGMRNTCQVFIEVDLAKAMQDGMDWYLSKNKVILTAGFDKTVPPKYFKKVVDKNGKDLLAGTNQVQQQQFG